MVGDTRNWLKMQEDMQRAEHDKILILKELEEKSREFMRFVLALSSFLFFSFLMFLLIILTTFSKQREGGEEETRTENSADAKSTNSWRRGSCGSAEDSKRV